MIRAVTLRRFVSCVMVAVAVLLSVTVSNAQTSPTLGTAISFAVLAGTTVTNTGPTIIYGNIGVSPGSAVTGFPPGSVVPGGGTIYAGGAIPLQAQNDVTTAFLALSQSCTITYPPTQNLGGLTLTHGVYCFSSSAQLMGTLTLDFQGNPNNVFIFRIASTLTTATNAVVLPINTTSLCNVWWQIGSSATIGVGTRFVGNILALTSISVQTGASIVPGRALARNGQVSLDTNNISIQQCIPALTATPANTLPPTATNTAGPGPTSTPRPGPTNAPPPTASTAIPALTLPPVAHLPATGYPPPEQSSMLWLIPAAGGLFVLMAGVWTFRRTKKRR